MSKSIVTQTSYNPGRATVATKNADGTWSVPSFKGEDIYLVNLELRSCSCPSAKHRPGPCKHLIAVSTQAVYLDYLEKARRCSPEQLTRLLAKYVDDAMVSGALRVAREERKAAETAAQRDADLRKVFA